VLPRREVHRLQQLAQQRRGRRRGGHGAGG
jgi:hypothetical protein